MSSENERTRQMTKKWLKSVENQYVKFGDVLVKSTGVGTLGRVAQYVDKNDISFTVDSHVTIVRPKKGYFMHKFFGYVMIMIENEIMKSGRGSSGQTELSNNDLSNIIISFPKNKIEQKRIVEDMEIQRNIVEGNKQLLEIYSNKIKEKIKKIWMT